MSDSLSREEGRIAVRRIIAIGSFFCRKENGKDCFVFKKSFKIIHQLLIQIYNYLMDEITVAMQYGSKG